MATVTPLFPPSAPPPRVMPAIAASHAGTPLPQTGGRRGEYAIADIARELSLLHRSIRTIVDTLRALAKDAGMPLPRTPRVLKGEVVRGPRSICKDSRWDAAEIDAWLDDRPPTAPAGAARARPLAPPLRAQMAVRARLLGAA